MENPVNGYIIQLLIYNTMKKNIAIILAGGRGVRFSNEIPKQFVRIAGRRIIEYTIEKFEKNKNIDEIFIVVNPLYCDLLNKIINDNHYKKITKILKGGKTRQESSWIGISACDGQKTDKVLIHDAVRPFVSERIINAVINNLDKYVAVDVAIFSADTIIKVNNDRIITDIPKRSSLMRGQTPQGFQYDTIKKAHILANRNKDFSFSEDCAIVLKYRLGKVFVVEGEEKNMKITHPLDISLADKLFQLGSINIDIKEGFDFQILKRKNILIFGHSSGIGKAIYNICKENNANVVGFSLSNGVDIHDFSLVKEKINEFVAKNGKIDILVSTVGVLQRKRLVDFDIDDINNQIVVNYVAQINIVKSAISKMAKGGSIALFTSSSYTRGRASYSIYSSTKAAIVNLVQAVSEEIMPVKINAICPARTNTPMRRKNFGKEPAKTLLDPKDVAKITLRTCLSDITGQVIDIRK